MENKNYLFDFEFVPQGYMLCFAQECPLGENCMRRLAGEHVPANLTRGAAVYPNAQKDGKCPFFKQIRMVKAAKGFGDLLAHVKRSDYPRMLAMLKRLVGSGGTYYRYRSGERLLMPEQQERIRQLMRDHGYSDDVAFKRYVTVFDFS